MSDEPSRLQVIEAPVQGFFGGSDRLVPVGDVESFEMTMQELGKSLELEIFPDAGHGFANPEGRSYDAALADRAWQRSLDFFDTSLYSADVP